MVSRLFPTAIVVLLTVASLPAQSSKSMFRVHVVDSQTLRGVPMIELRTVHEVRYVTDSRGMAAIHEPTLWNKDVFFHVGGHGYEMAADGFGFRGVRVRLQPGGSVRIVVQRKQPAERLYRITGAGLYRDSVLLGDRAPVKQPLLNGGVMGQDTVMTAIYRGKIYWFWGDTDLASYPLGNFHTSGATSLLPGRGGLDPANGIDLSYFTNNQGVVRKMLPTTKPGPVWVSGLMVVKDRNGRDRLMCQYVRVKTLGTLFERGIAEWNDTTQRFGRVKQIPIDSPTHPDGVATKVVANGEAWYYFAMPYPAVRVRAVRADVLDPSRYESFTCLKAGAKWSDTAPAVDRQNGRLVWGFKRHTATVTPERFKKLVQLKLATQDESWMNLRDLATGESLQAHSASVVWNDYRQKWVMIFEQFGGKSSLLGEIWFAEADRLEGPWSYAAQVVTHDRYSFYNVLQHPYFAQQGGRFIFFEGTYTTLFSTTKVATPRYDYNQVMYRLDLADQRLILPEPIYRLQHAGATCWAPGRFVAKNKLWSLVRDVPFYAVPLTRALPSSVVVRQVTTRTSSGAVTCGLVRSNAGVATFRGLPARLPNNLTRAVALYEWNNTTTRALDYRITGDAPAGAGWRRALQPLCYVWAAPQWDRR